MGKGAETFIVAFIDVVGVKLAELGLVAIRVVQLFEFVMGEFTFLIIAFLFSANKMIVLNV